MILHPKIINTWASQRSVCTDTRKLQVGDLFFALKGDRFNGNEFASQALQAGASLAIVDEVAWHQPDDERYVLVNNALEALQDLARHERQQHHIPFIALTGSNGKTTTKELVASVLSMRYRVHYTRGNLNNHIGVPLTLLSIPTATEIAVIEMGANKPGDIRELCEIALPTHGLITNIGHAHLELMGGLEGVERTKGELFDSLRDSNGLVFVNEKDAGILRRAQGIHRRVTCGTLNSDFYLSGLTQHERGTALVVSSRHWSQPHTFTTSLIGGHNADNVLHAIAVGWEMGVPLEQIREGIARYQPTMSRSQFLQADGFAILLDAYNANPSSMEAVIRHIFSMNYGKVALVLGDMFELGDQSEEMHRQLGRLVAELPVNKVVGLGRQMKFALEECAHTPQTWFLTAEQAADSIAAELKGNDLILIKGSRGMALEKLLPALGIHGHSGH